MERQLMLNKLITQSLFGAVILGLTMPAQAADLDSIISLPNAPTVKPVEIGSGWYLRGDIGYTAELENDGGSFNTYSGANGYRAGTLNSESYDDKMAISVGVGYRINDMLRTDATLDIIRGDYAFTGTGRDRCAGAPANTTCSFAGNTDYTGYSAMLNAYVDLATISGFTPYVGAGAGFTKVQWDTTTINGECVNGGGACGATADVANIHEGLSDWRPTWAVMAGLSYDVSNQVKVDLGYRYSQISGGNAYGYDETSMGRGASGVQGRFGDIARHEARVGVRLTSW